MIPPGLHFLYHGTGMGSRQGFFLEFSGPQIMIKQWDTVQEEISPTSEISEASYNQLIKDLDRGALNDNLGPYPIHQHHIWKNVSNFISADVLARADCSPGTLIYPGDDSDISERIPTTKQKMRPPIQAMKPFYPGAARVANFTDIKRMELELIESLPPSSNRPSEITALMMDKSKLLEYMIKSSFNGSPMQLLGELQLGFLMFMLLYSYPGLQQWKELIYTICCSETFLQSNQNFAAAFMRVLYSQLNFTPADFFENELSVDNFLRPAVTALFSSLTPSTSTTTVSTPSPNDFALYTAGLGATTEFSASDPVLPQPGARDGEARSDGAIPFTASLLEHKKRLRRFLQKKFNLYETQPFSSTDAHGAAVLYEEEDFYNITDEDMPAVVTEAELEGLREYSVQQQQLQQLQLQQQEHEGQSKQSGNTPLDHAVQMNGGGGYGDHLDRSKVSARSDSPRQGTSTHFDNTCTAGIRKGLKPRSITSAECIDSIFDSEMLLQGMNLNEPRRGSGAGSDTMMGSNRGLEDGTLDEGKRKVRFEQTMVNESDVTRGQYQSAGTTAVEESNSSSSSSSNSSSNVNCGARWAAIDQAMMDSRKLLSSEAAIKYSSYDAPSVPVSMEGVDETQQHLQQLQQHGSNSSSRKSKSSSSSSETSAAREMLKKTKRPKQTLQHALSTPIDVSSAQDGQAVGALTDVEVSKRLAEVGASMTVSESPKPQLQSQSHIQGQQQWKGQLMGVLTPAAAEAALYSWRYPLVYESMLASQGSEDMAMAAVRILEEHLATDPADPPGPTDADSDRTTSTQQRMLDGLRAERSTEDGQMEDAGGVHRGTGRGGGGGGGGASVLADADGEVGGLSRVQLKEMLRQREDEARRFIEYEVALRG